ncbi:MAG: hypothetical protein U0802_09055 [Candidatus Binatia bacterium]
MASAGELLRYTLTFGNPGATALNDVALTAQLPFETTLESASDGGMAAGGVVTWSLGSVQAGQSGQRQFRVEVPAGAVDGDVLESAAEIRGAGGERHDRAYECPDNAHHECLSRPGAARWSTHLLTRVSR